MKTVITGPFTGQSAVCEPILNSLPQWFGIEASNQQYLRDIEVLLTFLARRDDCVVGFLTLKQHNPYAAEVHIMGVSPELHTQGIGRGLIAAGERFLQQQGVEYLQVKTLSATHPDEYYARTRAFYGVMGFRPLEEFKTLWDAANPCLLMVKSLK